MITVEALGLSCPQPVILAKQALERNPAGVIIVVDSVTAKDNVKRFVMQQGYLVKVKEKGAIFEIEVRR